MPRELLAIWRAPLAEAAGNHAELRVQVTQYKSRVLQPLHLMAAREHKLHVRLFLFVALALASRLSQQCMADEALARSELDIACLSHERVAKRMEICLPEFAPIDLMNRAKCFPDASDHRPDAC